MKSHTYAYVSSWLLAALLISVSAAACSASAETPDHLKFPYVSTYYVKPTVLVGEKVKLEYFVTDWDSSKIRLLDDSFRFDVHLEYGRSGEPFKVLVNRGVKSGDGVFEIGKLPVGDYTLRVWSVDLRRGLESHRVVHEFRVVRPEDLDRSKSTYVMTEADLAKYGINNKGATEEPVKVGEPGWRELEEMGCSNVAAIAKMIGEMAAAGVHRLVMLPGTYRLSHTGLVEMPDRFTLDLNGATLKENGFTGDKAHLVRFWHVNDSHLVNGILDGDFYEHDYKNSKNSSEGVLGICMIGDCRYCSISNVVIRNITGYGASNGLGVDRTGSLHLFHSYISGDWTPGSLDPKSGKVVEDAARFTSPHQKFRSYIKGSKYLQVSKYLGYQGVVTRSWNMTVCWYGAGGAFISGETAYQYRSMLIPPDAETFRVSVEVSSSDEVRKTGISATNFYLPWNCALVDCKFENCRAVGFAPAAMKNFLVEGNEFTRCGQTLAKCAIDAEDGWDQMQDVTFRGNRFHDNPFHDLLTCGGHDFVFENNKGAIYLWGRTRSPCVRGNSGGKATFKCDSRIRSGYGRFENNQFGCMNFGNSPYQEWDYVLAGLVFEGTPDSRPVINAGATGRFVDCTFRACQVNSARLERCRLEDCSAQYMEGALWRDVSVSSCTFRNFDKRSTYRDCAFTNTHFANFGKGCDISFEKCRFEGGDLVGFPSGRATWSSCALNGFAVSPSAWQPAGVLSFEDCDITTTVNRPVLALAPHAIGNIGFAGCRIAGTGELFCATDYRHHPVEGQSGCLWMSNCTYSAAAPFAVMCRPSRERTTKKTISLCENGCDFKNGTAFCDEATLPKTWHRQ